jgi:hypothetical protein
MPQGVAEAEADGTDRHQAKEDGQQGAAAQRKLGIAPGLIRL